MTGYQLRGTSVPVNERGGSMVEDVSWLRLTQTGEENFKKLANKGVLDMRVELTLNHEGSSLQCETYDEDQITPFTLIFDTDKFLESDILNEIGVSHSLSNLSFAMFFVKFVVLNYF